MKVIIAGSRGFSNYKLLKLKCDKILKTAADIEVVSGAAQGADALGERYAKDKGYKIRRFPADWLEHGNRAGYLRNKEMAEYADALIAFWDKKSPGTKMMIDLAKQYNLKIRVIYFA